MLSRVTRFRRAATSIIAVFLLMLCTARMPLHAYHANAGHDHATNAMHPCLDEAPAIDGDPDAGFDHLHVHFCADTFVDAPMTATLPIASDYGRRYMRPSCDEWADNLPLEIDLPPVERA